MRTERITRKNKREAVESLNFCVELLKIIEHFFPELIGLLKQEKDPRHQSYVTYESQVILFVRILGTILHVESMRKITEILNKSICFKNISKILKLKEELTELPHWDTINNYLKKLSPAVLEEIVAKLVHRLTRMRSFENSRIRNKYWHVIVDGTHLHTFDERHCEHCLTREFKNDAGKVVRTEYYHVALEAKLVINFNIVISIGTEFVENESPIVSKQDCELKAFYRLAEKLKNRFPRLPICLGLDSLYAAGPVFDLCKKYNWHYIIRFKDGSIPSVADEFHVLKEMEPEQAWEQTLEGVTKTYCYVTQIPYQTYELNMLEYQQSNLNHPFVFVTDLSITKHNAEQLVIDGRRRWKIENEGFNEQKNHGMGLEHMFSKDYNAMKNHYFLIQIGHMIAQFLELGLVKLKALGKIPVSILFDVIKEAFRTVLLTAADFETVQQLKQYRLC